MDHDQAGSGTFWQGRIWNSSYPDPDPNMTFVQKICKILQIFFKSSNSSFITYICISVENFLNA